MALRMLEAAPDDQLNEIFPDHAAAGDDAGATDGGMAGLLDTAITDGELRRRRDVFVKARWHDGWLGLRAGARAESADQVRRYRDGDLTADLALERQSGLVRSRLAANDRHQLRDLLDTAGASTLRELLNDARLRRDLLDVARPPASAARYYELQDWVLRGADDLYDEPSVEPGALPTPIELRETDHFQEWLGIFLRERFDGGLEALEAGLVAPKPPDGAFSGGLLDMDRPLPAELGIRGSLTPGEIVDALEYLINPDNRPAVMRVSLPLIEWRKAIGWKNALTEADKLMSRGAADPDDLRAVLRGPGRVAALVALDKLTARDLAAVVADPSLRAELAAAFPGGDRVHEIFVDFATRRFGGVQALLAGQVLTEGKPAEVASLERADPALAGLGPGDEPSERQLWVMARVTADPPGGDLLRELVRDMVPVQGERMERLVMWTRDKLAARASRYLDGDFRETLTDEQHGLLIRALLAGQPSVSELTVVGGLVREARADVLIQLRDDGYLTRLSALAWDGMPGIAVEQALASRFPVGLDEQPSPLLDEDVRGPEVLDPQGIIPGLAGLAWNDDLSLEQLRSLMRQAVGGDTQRIIAAAFDWREITINQVTGLVNWLLILVREPAVSQLTELISHLSAPELVSLIHALVGGPGRRAALEILNRASYPVLGADLGPRLRRTLEKAIPVGDPLRRELDDVVTRRFGGWDELAAGHLLEQPRPPDVLEQLAPELAGLSLTQEPSIDQLLEVAGRGQNEEEVRKTGKWVSEADEGDAEKWLKQNFPRAQAIQAAARHLSGDEPGQWGDLIRPLLTGGPSGREMALLLLQALADSGQGSQVLAADPELLADLRTHVAGAETIAELYEIDDPLLSEFRDALARAEVPAPQEAPPAEDPKKDPGKPVSGTRRINWNGPPSLP
jgi:hypothetical protein